MAKRSVKQRSSRRRISAADLQAAIARSARTAAGSGSVQLRLAVDNGRVVNRSSAPKPFLDAVERSTSSLRVSICEAAQTHIYRAGLEASGGSDEFNAALEQAVSKLKTAADRVRVQRKAGS